MTQSNKKSAPRKDAATKAVVVHEIKETAAQMPATQQGKAPVAYTQLLELAVMQGADIEKLGKLMELQERWEKKEAKKAFLDAMSNFQAEIPPIAKDKEINFTTTKGGRMNYKHATLGGISEAIKTALRNNGLSYRWETEDTTAQILVRCIASHRDGHSEITVMTAEKDDSGQKNNIQQKASTITYLKRYTLLGSFGIATADTDLDGHIPGIDEDNHQEAQPFNPTTTVITFGKHAKDPNKKVLWKDLPVDYLEWLRDNGKEDGKANAITTLAFLQQGVAPQQAQTATANFPAQDDNNPYNRHYEDDTEGRNAIDALVETATTVKQLLNLYFANQLLIEKFPGIKRGFTAKKEALHEAELQASRQRGNGNQDPDKKNAEDELAF